jgi:hypothetical protein
MWEGISDPDDVIADDGELQPSLTLTFEAVDELPVPDDPKLPGDGLEE